jgi:hypothetical protein
MFGAINRWLTGRLPSRRYALRIGVTDGGLVACSDQSGCRLFAWSEVERVVAANYPGGGFTLVFGFTEGRVLSFTDDMEEWRRLTDILPEKLRGGAKRHAEWSVELIASGAESVEVYPYEPR